MSPILCVALDTPAEARALELAEQVRDQAGMFKVGLTLTTGSGSGIVRRLAQHGPVFLDLKFHDIPAQVAGAVTAAAGSGASLTTVHAAGGRPMLVAAAAAARDTGLKVLAVTVLTSLSDADLDAIGLSGPAPEAVLRLAELALGAGVDGLVCSPLEVAAIRGRFGAEPLLVVPGVRPAASVPDDQARTTTPGAAIAAGADVLVVGRPVTAAPDPVAAARSIAEEMGEARR